MATEINTTPTPDIIMSGDFLEGTQHVLKALNDTLADIPNTSGENLISALNLRLKSDQLFRETYPQVGIIKPGEKGRKISWVPRESQTPKTS